MENDFNDALTCGEETCGTGSLRRADPGIFFRTRVTPLGFSCSFFTRFALLQPTWHRQLFQDEGYRFRHFAWTVKTGRIHDTDRRACTYCIHCITHHYLVVDLNHFITRQYPHIDIVQGLQKEEQTTSNIQNPVKYPAQ